MKRKDETIEKVSNDTNKIIAQLKTDSINIILSDYKAAIKSITEAFNDRLARYDKQIAPELKVHLQPLQRIKELPDYGEDYRTDKPKTKARSL